jgi:bla regulator protein BlaR1
MTLKYLAGIWTAIAPALGNHLWQSTLFAITAGLLTLILRKNQARARYWLWLAASVKFLVPFSLLVGIGNYLAWPRGPAGTNSGLYFVMEGVGQPFTQPFTQPMIRAVSTSSTVSTGLIHLLPVLLGGAWLCGFVMVLLIWYVRWRRVSAATRKSVPLLEGREVKALRRLERAGGTRKRIEILLSSASLEPGIFGIARPILVWPEGISERLEDAHLEAILAHEVLHVRRRDNLAAAFHMVVEAIFWFHPLVWWLGVRLVEERERACDEEVLALGSERQVYAESILKICEFCVGSPLACVSGVTGADLKKRIVYIMTKSISRKLDFSRKLVLTLAGFVAIFVPIVFGLVKPVRSQAESHAQNTAGITPGFESVSIKPNKSGSNTVRDMHINGRYTGTNVTLQMLIRDAYEVQNDQISRGPSWLTSEKYDIAAKYDLRNNVEWKLMLQALLADRFKLALHRETRELPIYALVIAKNGPRLQEAKPGDTYPKGFKDPNGRPEGGGLIRMERGQLTVQGVPVASLAWWLSGQLGRLTLDKTGLMGNYDFTLKWAEDDQRTNNTSLLESSGIFTAVQEQLGLKLEPQKAPIEVLVIDRVEKPAEN